MIDSNDPLHRLRIANPVAAPDRAAASTAAAVDLLERIVAASPAGPDRRRRFRWRARLLVPAVLLTGAAGAAGYAVMNNNAAPRATVACFERADPQARTEVVVSDGRGAAADCADLWAEGRFGGTGGPAPSLATCTLPSGTTGVFPADDRGDVCARLGLAAAVPLASTSTSSPFPATTVADENARFLAFRDAVLPQFLDAPCVDPDAARALVRRELDRAGLVDWTIRVGQGTGTGFSADRPCATLSFLPNERAVVLVPAPPHR